MRENEFQSDQVSFFERSHQDHEVCLGLVGVGTAPAAGALGHDVDEAAVVLHAALGPSGLGLLLLALVHLRRLTTHLAGTGEGAVYFATAKAEHHLHDLQVGAQDKLVAQGRGLRGEVEVIQADSHVLRDLDLKDRSYDNDTQLNRNWPLLKKLRRHIKSSLLFRK